MQLESEVSNEQVPHLGLRCIVGPGEVQHLWCEPPIETSQILVLGAELHYPFLPPSKFIY